jgi:hypothetical protein
MNQDKINQYYTLKNKADMEIEHTGWVSEETDDALEAVEASLTPQEINYICNEIEASMIED